LEATVLSIVLAALLAVPLLTPASTVEAATPATVMKEKKQTPPGETKTKKQKPPVITKSKHGAEKIRTARTKPADKNQDNTVTVNRGTVDPIGPVSRGQTIEISGTSLRSGQTCVFRLFYADKKGPVIRDVVPDDKKRCTASVTIPDRPGIVGDASVVLNFNKTTSGKRDGSARQAFAIN
jgi:hypothetical protein